MSRFDWLRRGLFNKRSDQTQNADDAELDPPYTTEPISAIPHHDFSFSDTKLKDLWQSASRPTSSKQESRNSFDAFLKEFVRVFADWDPDIEDSVQGHPIDVIGAIVQHFINSETAVKKPFPDRILSNLKKLDKKEDRAQNPIVFKEPRDLNTTELAALEILSRSPFNRYFLRHLQFFPRFFTIIQAANLLLRAIADRYSSSSSSSAAAAAATQPPLNNSQSPSTPTTMSSSPSTNSQNSAATVPAPLLLRGEYAEKLFELLQTVFSTCFKICSNFLELKYAALPGDATSLPNLRNMPGFQRRQCLIFQNVPWNVVALSSSFTALFHFQSRFPNQNWAFRLQKDFLRLALPIITIDHTIRQQQQQQPQLSNAASANSGSSSPHSPISNQSSDRFPSPGGGSSPLSGDQSKVVEILLGVLECLGWPVEFRFECSWYHTRLEDFNSANLEEHFEIQMLILKLLTDSISLCPQYLQFLCSHRIFERISELCHWVYFFFTNFNRHNVPLGSSGSQRSSLNMESNARDQESTELYNEVLDQLSLNLLYSAQNAGNSGTLVSGSAPDSNGAGAAGGIATNLPPTEFPCPTPIKKVANEKFHRLFNDYLWQLCIAGSVILKSQRAQNRSSNVSALSLPAADAAQGNLVCLVLDVFSENFASAGELWCVAQARRKMKACGDLQFYLLDFIFAVIMSEPKALPIFIEHGLYEVMFSEWLYFYGGEINVINQKSAATPATEDPHCVKEPTTTTIREVPPSSDVSKLTRAEEEGDDDLDWDQFMNKRQNLTTNPSVQMHQQQAGTVTTSDQILVDVIRLSATVLRTKVLELLKYAGTIQGRASNIDEVRKILQLLGCRASNSFLVHELATTLLEILHNNFQVTHESLVQLDAFSVVSRCIEAQHHNLRRLPKPQTMLVANLLQPDSEYAEALEAHSALLTVTDYILSTEDSKLQALRDPSTLNALFVCLHDPALKEFALGHITSLLKTQTSKNPMLESELFEPLITQYTALFPIIQAEPKPENMQLLWELLQCIQHLMTTPNRRVLQETFQHKLALIINLLNFEDHQFEQTLITQTDLCFQVLKTLGALFLHNRKAKEQFRTDIGYDQLTHVILRCFKNRPTHELFMQIFNMMVDGPLDFEKCCTITNQDMIPVLFNLCMEPMNMPRSASSSNHPSLSSTPDPAPIDHDHELFKEEHKQLVANVLDKFFDLIKQSVKNKSCCSQTCTLELLLSMLRHFTDDNKLRESIMQLIECLGQHSISVKELKGFFWLIKLQSSEVKSLALPLMLKSLHRMMQQRGPGSFFDFNGRTSGIILPTLKTWPSTKGYSICLWLRIERFEPTSTAGAFSSSAVLGLSSDGTISKHQPRLFSFLMSSGPGGHSVPHQTVGRRKSSDSHSSMHHHANSPTTPNAGFELFFDHDHLCVNVTFSNLKHHSQTLDFQFEERCWYFVAIVHTNSKGLGKSELKLFVDKQVVNKSFVKYPLINKPLDLCRIGTSFTHAEQHAFNGQMGAIWLFDEAITESQIRGIRSLGPNYMGTFQPVDVSFVGSTFQDMTILDGSLTSKIHLCYNPRASMGKTVLDTTPDRLSSATAPKAAGQSASNILASQDTNGRILKGTLLCDTHNVQDIIGCLGGIKVLFPLFLQMDQLSRSTESPDELDPYLTMELITLIHDMLRDHPDNQDDILRSRGFTIISHLLRQVSPQHLTLQTVRAIFSIPKTLQQNEALYNDILQNLLLEFKLWIYAPLDVQQYIVESLIAETNLRSATMRKLIGVQRVLDILRWFYWYSDDTHSNMGKETICNPVTGAILGRRPNTADTRRIRSLLLSLIKSMVGSTISFEEVNVILNFLLDCTDSGQLVDVLQMLLELMFAGGSSPTSIFEHLFNSSGLDILIALLTNKEEQVRIIVLHCIGKLLKVHPKLLARVQADVSHGFVHITRALQQFPFTLQTYRALRSVLLGDVSLDPISSQNDQAEFIAEKTQRFEVQSVLSTIFTLLLNADIGLRQTVIQDFVLLFKEKESREIFLRQRGWQMRLFSLMLPERHSSSSPSSSPLTTPLSTSFGPDMIPTTPTTVDSTATAPQASPPSPSPLPPPAVPASSGSGTDTADIQAMAIRDMVVEIFKVLIFHLLTTDKQGWRTLEETLSYVFVFQNQGLEPISFLSPFYRKLLDTYIVEFERGNISLPSSLESIKSGSGEKSSAAAIVLTNFVYLVRMIEEYLFYNRAIIDAAINAQSGSSSGDHSAILSSNASVGSINAIDTVSFSSGEVTESLRLRKRIHSNALPPLSTVFADPGTPGKSSPLISSRSLKPQLPSTPTSQQHVVADFGPATESLLASALQSGLFGGGGDVNPTPASSSSGTASGSSSAAPISSVVSSSTAGTMTNAANSSSTSMHSSTTYDAELELNRDPISGEWIDLAIAERVLILFEKCHLISVANFQALGVLAQDAKTHLRPGGALRVALRLIRYSLRESNQINERHIKCVHQIIKRDVEAEKERMRFSELWTVTGDTEEGDEFQNRLLYVLAFLFDTWTRIVDCERQLTDERQRQQKRIQAEELLKQIKSIFNDRKTMLMNELKNKEGKPLIRPDFILFDTSKPHDASNTPDTGRSVDKAWVEIIQSPGWQEAWILHFKKAVLHVEKEEGSFLNAITKRFKRIVEKSQKNVALLNQNEQDTERRFYIDLKKIHADRAEEKTRISTAISKYEESHRTAAHLWQQLWRNLSNERGPWSTSWSLEGEISDGTPVFWKLEVKLEDRMRRRIRLKRDYHGSSHAEATANQRGGPPTPVTVPSPPGFGQLKPGGLGMQLGLKKIISTSTRPDEESTNVEEDLLSTGGPILTPEDESEGMTSTGEEKKLHSVACDLVTPMQAFSGRMEITTRSVSWTPDELNKCVVHGKETVVKQYLKKPKDIKIAKEELRSIQFRRFRLEHLALEFFLMDDSSFLFAFGAGERLKVYKKILASKPPNLVQYSGLSPEELLKRTNLTSMWRNRVISNFEYLMQLNTISGRTYNDLSQYPIFPWIIADYESPTLDLNNPATFRDLSKPIGALNPDRLRELQLRCSQLDDAYTPKFLYGSFYSSPGITLYYLLRLEPFIKYAIVMQGGAFDVADRLFDSIGQTWRNCMTASSDVKELIPEFFYLPEFLVNRNSCDFGSRQTGARVDNVVLPPWSRTPEEFVHLNREALESDFVSEHLHEWIDLIWGFKQNGKEAWDADNYFFYLTYEHMVEQEKKKPEYDRNYIIASLDNYGQVPIQLFKRPHLKRLRIEECFNPYIDLRTLPNMKARFIQPITTATARTHAPSSSAISSFAMANVDSEGTAAVVIPGSAIVKICVTGERLVTVSANGAVSINRFANTSTSSSGQSPLPFSFVIDPNVATRRLGLPFGHDTPISSGCFEVMGSSTSSGRASGDTIIFSCVHWDPSFKCVAMSQSPTTGTVIQSVWRHKDTVTCLALCEDNHTLVTGSKDTTIMVWDLIAQSDSRQSPIAANPRHILFGHDDEVVCLAVRSDLDMVVSGSKDRTVIVHTLRQGRYVRTIRHPSKGRVEFVAIDDDGHIIMYSKDDLTLHVFTVNGTHLASVDTNERLHCMRVDGTFLITGGDKRVVCVRRVFNLEVVNRFDLKSEMAAMSMGASSIRSLFVTKEHPKLLLVGLADGSLVFFAAEMSVG